MHCGEYNHDISYTVISLGSMHDEFFLTISPNLYLRDAAASFRPRNMEAARTHTHKTFASMLHQYIALTMCIRQALENNLTLPQREKTTHRS